MTSPYAQSGFRLRFDWGPAGAAEVGADLVAVVDVLSFTTAVTVAVDHGAVRDADRIAVLVDGRIAELGSHTALVSAGGTYARLFELQASGYSSAAPDER